MGLLQIHKMWLLRQKDDVIAYLLIIVGRHVINFLLHIH
jgi:hypothetical protein